MTSVTDYDDLWSGSPVAQNVTAFEYDAVGNVTRVTDAKNQ